MGIFDFLFGKIKKNTPDITTEQSQKYSPIVPYKEKHDAGLEAITLAAQAVSDKFQQKHNANISAFDYRSLQNTNETELSSVEKNFLKYVSGRPVHDTYIAGYWTHEYGLNYALVMSKFFNLGMLTVGIDFQHCTVDVLKNLLRTRQLPVSGKKKDLLTRIATAEPLSDQELGSLEEYRAYIPTEYGNAIIRSMQETERKGQASSSLPERKMRFTKEEVEQHKENFSACLNEALRKEKLTIQAKELNGGWRRFLWQDCQIGQIKFSRYGHRMQWIGGAYTVDWDKATKKEINAMVKYIHETCGEVFEAKDLNLQECITKIPYWIQYIHILIEDKDL